MESVIPKKRLLLIDDEPRVRASLKMVLEPLYDIAQASDGPEGLDIFRKEGDQWLIAHRKIRVDWRSPDSLFPPLD